MVNNMLRCLILAVSLLLAWSSLAEAKNKCKPVTWTTDGHELDRRGYGIGRPATPTLNLSALLATATDSSDGDDNDDDDENGEDEPESTVSPGTLVCRLRVNSPKTVNYYTCQQFTDDYNLRVGQFYTLNPILEGDCANIKPNTPYCVRGCKIFLSTSLFFCSSLLSTSSLS